MANYSSASSKESLVDYQRIREQLKRENEELKKKLALLGIIPDSTFLPLKPDSENDLTSSKQAIITATLTDADSTLSSYLPLPTRNKQAQIQSEAQETQRSPDIPAKREAERVMMKADLLLERTQNIQPTAQRNSGDHPEKSLSDYTLTSDGFSVSPQRSSEENNNHVRIGFRKFGVRKDSSDSTIPEVEAQQKTVQNQPKIAKKLHFYNSSEEELSEIEENSKKYQDNIDKDWGKRVVGEIAFQLDRRILQYIFSHRRRLYGFTVRNISEKIQEISSNDLIDGCDTAKVMDLELKRDKVMKNLLEQANYDSKYHAIFSELIVNKYGILKVNPCDAKEQLKALKDFDVLKKLVMDNVDPEYKKDMIILLKALNVMSTLDRKSILSW